MNLVNVIGWKACLAGILGLMLCVSGNEMAQATTGVGPYVVPQVLDADDNPNNGIETWIVASEASVQIGNGVGANNAMTFKSCSNAALTTCTPPGIPGPEFRLRVGDKVIVHYVNKLTPSDSDPEAKSGIHWHGIELNNQSDGSELTQAAVDPEGTFDYKFIVSRPGIFWYHPHHRSSTNQVAKGLYGSIIIEDNRGEAPGYEQRLRNLGVIPSAEQTKTLVISDITVCGSGLNGSNPATFDGNLPHVSGIQSWQINYQNHPLTQSPLILCETDPLDANGVYTPNLYGAGDIPNIQSPGLTGRMSEGFTVLTNGVTVGARAGTPAAPGALAAGAVTLPVQAGQGLRLQIVNPSPVRYVRLLLTDNSGKQIDLVRIGGEGGFLNNALVEGGSSGKFVTHYELGEILLPPASRADVVANIPGNAAQNSVLTLWTEDYQRVEATYSWLPTVPVMHLKVAGHAAPQPNIANGTALLASFGAQAMVKVLGGPMTDLVLDAGEKGSLDKDIKFTFTTNTGAFEASVEGIPMPREFTGFGADGMGNFGSGNPFYLESARHAIIGNTLELTMTNTTGAHHPFHLHGFSVQPIKLTPRAGISGPSYNFPKEFRDVVDVPGNYTLTFRFSMDDRKKNDLLSDLGALGRWMFHCHILPHATFGMRSELHVHPTH
ncbi:MAG: multicopper oxidase domain-containing protein [Nitrospira sp.]